MTYEEYQASFKDYPGNTFNFNCSKEYALYKYVHHFLSFVNNKVVELRAIEKLNNSFIPCVIAGFISALLVKVIYDCGLDDLSGSGVGVVFFIAALIAGLLFFLLFCVLMRFIEYDQKTEFYKQIKMAVAEEDE